MQQFQGGKYLTFSLGREDYGIPILQVREIIGMMEFTVIPKTPAYIKGVINLRGKIIPIMNLRAKFGMPEIEETEKTCIIVVEFKVNETTRPMGIIVDQVSDVVNIDESEIEKALDYGATVDGDFLMGLGKIKERVVMILNIEKILTTEDVISLMKNVSEQSAGV